MTPRQARPTLDADRRAALRAAKLAALVSRRWGPGRRETGAAAASPTLVETPPRPPAGEAGAGSTGGVSGGVTGVTGWVLVEAGDDRALGPARGWGDRRAVDTLHLVAEPGSGAAAGALARRAALFARPPLAVWTVEGEAVVGVEPAPVPERRRAVAPPDLVDVLIDAGVEIVAEGGMVRGEVNGLEVARIVSGRTTAGQPIDEPLLEVGVGKADRELTAMVHGGLSPVDQLARVVDIVRQHRRPGAARHPLNQLVPERWLRAVLCRRPELAGLASLRPAEGTRPRANLRERDVAVAEGETAGGEPVVVACAVGIALDLVPAAADARLALATPGTPAPRLLLAVPARDDHAVTRRLAAQLVEPAEVVTVPDDWRAAG